MIPEPHSFEDLLSDRIAWVDRLDDAVLSGVPTLPAVVLLCDEADRPVQLLSSQNLRRTLRTRLVEPTPDGRRADVSGVVRAARWRIVASRFEADWIHLLTARRWRPRGYGELVALGRAWFVKLDLSSTPAQFVVTERVWSQPGPCVGPFPSRRTATDTLDLLVDLFDLCRHPRELARVPNGRRCAYVELGRCDGPCDGGAPLAPMLDRTAAAERFLSGNAADWVAQADARMRGEAAALRFEAANLLKQQVEAAQRWRKFSEARLRVVPGWRELLLVPLARRKAVKPFVFLDGALNPGPVLKRASASEGASAWALQHLTSPPAGDTPADLLDEQTWIVARHTDPDRPGRVPTVRLESEIDAASLSSRVEAALSAKTA